MNTLKKRKWVLPTFSKENAACRLVLFACNGVLLSERGRAVNCPHKRAASIASRPSESYFMRQTHPLLKKIASEFLRVEISFLPAAPTCAANTVALNSSKKC